MSSLFTSKDFLEEFVWLIFYNSEKLPEEDWCTPSERIWKNILQSIQQEEQIQKQKNSSKQPLSLI